MGLKTMQPSWRIFFDMIREEREGYRLKTFQLFCADTALTHPKSWKVFGAGYNEHNWKVPTLNSFRAANFSWIKVILIRIRLKNIDAWIEKLYLISKVRSLPKNLDTIFTNSSALKYPLLYTLWTSFTYPKKLDLSCPWAFNKYQNLYDFISPCLKLHNPYSTR